MIAVIEKTQKTQWLADNIEKDYGLFIYRNGDGSFKAKASMLAHRMHLLNIGVKSAEDEAIALTGHGLDSHLEAIRKVASILKAVNCTKSVTLDNDELRAWVYVMELLDVFCDKHKS